MRFSTTERQQFRRCRRAWKWGGKSQANLEPRQTAHSLSFGSAIHEALAAYHLSGIDAEVAFFASPHAAHFSAEQNELGSGMLTHYMKWNASQEPLEFLVAEYPFEIVVPGTDHIYSGIVDGIAKDKAGKMWIVEHKSYAQLASTQRLMLDDQVTSYMWAMQETLGIPLEGVMYNQLKKKLPVTPRLLKSGELQAMTADMTYETVLAAIREYGFDPDDYTETLLRLYHKGNQFFRREMITRGPEAVASIRERIIMEVGEMADPNLPIYPNITYECDRCPFYNPCLAVENGADPDYLLTNLYKAKDTSHRQL